MMYSRTCAKHNLCYIEKCIQCQAESYASIGASGTIFVEMGTERVIYFPYKTKHWKACDL